MNRESQINKEREMPNSSSRSRKTPSLSRRKFIAGSSLATAASLAIPLPAMAAGLQAATPPTEKPTDPPPPVTRILSEWVVNCKPSDVSDAARKEAVRSIVNYAAVTLGGSKEDAVEASLAALLPLGCGTGNALFGRAERLDILRAALVSGISSHVLDFDDTDLRTVVHPAGCIASSLFALSQTHPMSGAEFLHAFIVGVEIECRLGRALYPTHYSMGWHITGTCGAFGAAAACGKALNFNAHQIEMALGIAATEAAGLQITFGSMSKALNIGRGAENGLLAALFAAKGYTSTQGSLEGKFGYVTATSTEHDYTALTDGLNQHFEITHNTYKPFACGIVIHPIIDAMLQFRKADGLKPSDVRSITIHANPLVLQLTGKKEPKVGLEGKFSVYHTAAVALVRGYAGPNEFTDEAVNDPKVVALRLLVTVQVDPSISSDEAYVTVTTVDGRTLSKHVEHAIGSLERPLTDSDLSEKYRQLCKGVLPESQSEDLLARIWKIEGVPDAGELPRLGAKQAKAKG